MENPVSREEGQPLFRWGKSPLQTLLKPCYVRQFGWNWKKGRMNGDCGADTRPKRGRALASDITSAYSLTFKISCFEGNISKQNKQPPPNNNQVAATAMKITAWSVSIHLPHKNVDLLMWVEIKSCLTDQWQVCHTSKSADVHEEKWEKCSKGSDNRCKIFYHGSCNLLSSYLYEIQKSKRKKNLIKIEHWQVLITCWKYHRL